MADNSTTVFQRITKTEMLLARLIKNNQDVGFTFSPTDKENSLLYSPELEKFVEQLRQTLKDFRFSSGSTSLVSIELDLLGIEKESITKQVFRDFFNALTHKFVSDHLDNTYAYLSSFPFFPDTDSTEILPRDEEVVSDWEEKLIEDFEKAAKSNGKEKNEEESEEPEEKEEEKNEEDEISDEAKAALGALLSPSGGQAGQNVQPAPQAANQPTNYNPNQVGTTQNAPTSLSIQKLAAQEGWRDSSILMDEILNSAFEVKDWHALYNSLAPEQQRALDFQLFSIQEDLAGVISLYLQERPEFALLLSQSQLSVTDRLRIRSALMAHVDEIYKRLSRYEYFLLKTEVLKEELGLKTAFDPAHFKGSEQTAQDATKLFMEKQDAEETGPKNYSLLQQQEFKRQLKQIAVFNALISNESIEELGKRIQQVRPGASEITIADLNLIVQQMTGTGYSLPPLGIDERKQLLTELNTYLSTIHADGKTINDGNFENFRKFKGFEKSNPKEALASLLKEYGIDGVAEKNIRNSLDAYVLSLGSPHLLSDNLKGVLNAIDPRIRNNNELLRILESYVAERKYTLADYTSNNLLTYSLEPDAATPLAFSTEQYRQMILVYSQRYQGDTDKILAHAFFNRELADIPADVSEQERYFREEAIQVRNSYLKELEKGIQTASAVDKQYYAQLFGVNRQQFEADEQGENQYNKALFQAAQQYQPWNAPQVGGGKDMVRGLENLKSWLGKAKGLGNINAQGLSKVATNLTSSQIKKGIAVVGGSAGAGLAIYGLISNLVQGVVGSTLGGVAGGAVAGGIVGSFFPIIGTGVGAVVGGIGGGIAGLIKGLADSGSSGAVSSASTAARSFIQDAGQSAFSSASNGATSIANAATNTFTASSATISSSTTTVAVAVPMTAVGVLTILTTQMILVSFLPDASTTQVAPYYSTDVEESRYITVKKIPDPSNADTPGIIKYKLEISKKSGAQETIVITDIADTPSAIDKDLNSIAPPSVPTSVTDLLATVNGKPLEGNTPIILEFELDASDARFKDSLVKNDVKVKFKANDIDEEANSRAQTCFGDCPQTAVAACWPIDGRVSQLPPYTGPRSNPTALKCIPGGGGTHCRGLGPNYVPDAYDIGTIPPGLSGEVPIYASAPGTVVHSSRSEEESYGYYVKIDHGTYQTMYLHMATASPKQEGDIVEGGEQIGLVGGTGGSRNWAPHLHYEITGLNEYVIYSTLKGEYLNSTKDIGIVCNEYYGR